MSYLSDPWIRVCAGLGFSFAASCAIFTYLLGIYTSGPDSKMSPYLAMTLQLLYLVYILAALDFGLSLSGPQPYTFVFAVGGATGVPLMYRVSHKLKARGIKFG